MQTVAVAAVGQATAVGVEHEFFPMSLGRGVRSRRRCGSLLFDAGGLYMRPLCRVGDVRSCRIIAL